MTPLIPTRQQLDRAKMFGWDYLGDGLFERDFEMGAFTIDGWVYL